MLRTRRPRMSLVERLRNQTKVLRAEWNRPAAKNLLELVFRDLPTTLSLRERVFRFAEIDETFFQFGRVDIRLGKQAGILNRSRRGNRHGHRFTHKLGDLFPALQHFRVVLRLWASLRTFRHMFLRCTIVAMCELEG